MTTNSDAARAAVQTLTSGEGRRRRIAAGVGLVDLAAAIDVHPTTLHRWETGASIPAGMLTAARYWRRLNTLCSGPACTLCGHTPAAHDTRRRRTCSCCTEAVHHTTGMGDDQ